MGGQRHISYEEEFQIIDVERFSTLKRGNRTAHALSVSSILVTFF